ncbi:MAG: ABC transporter ATP-binding protein [Treponema sp.]|jgi:oligopeptide/dipeptide ABC transporter ATP-binding protein|nr:ABC transporter ATP-binding protein [Treponema sp.]
MALLEVKDLVTWFDHPQGRVIAVDGISFDVDESECFGIIGESGCGKSMTAMSIMAYHRELGAHNGGGQVLLQGEDILRLAPGKLSEYRGKKIAIILQNPMSALNPLFSVGNQVEESIHYHLHLGRKQERMRVKELFQFLGIPPERRGEYPFQMSGGMLQRAAGGVAIASSPRLIIADEPTTALDATVQLQYLQLLRKIQREKGTAILLISHDIRVIALMCSKVAVMYAGRIVEMAPLKTLMENPKHPYTEALLRASNPLAKKTDRIYSINGQPPFLLNPTASCRFADRCSYCTKQCRQEAPQQTGKGGEHYVECWRAAE